VFQILNKSADHKKQELQGRGTSENIDTLEMVENAVWT